MNYHIKASSISNQDASIHIKQSNIDLLKKKFEKLGTIYNTVKLSCSISVTISSIENV